MLLTYHLYDSDLSTTPRQTEKMDTYVADLTMLSKELASDAWISSLDEKLKDSNERRRVIKVSFPTFAQEESFIMSMFRTHVTRSSTRPAALQSNSTFGILTSSPEDYEMIHDQISQNTTL